MQKKDKTPAYDYFNKIFKVATQEKPVTDDELNLVLEQKGFVDPPNNGNGGNINLRNLRRDWEEKTDNIIINVKRNKKGKPYGYYKATTTEHFDQELRRIIKTEARLRERFNRILRIRNSDPKRASVPVDIEYNSADYEDYLDLLNRLGL